MSDCFMCECVCRGRRWAYVRCHRVVVFVYRRVCTHIYACMRVPEQCVESVVLNRLTVTDLHTLTTGVKKLNALYALFSP